MIRSAGEIAQQYAPFFSFSAETRIVAVEIHAVGTHSTTARYSSHENPWYEVNNILRIRTASGEEGVSGVDSYHEGDFSKQLLLELQGVSTELLALETLDPVEVGGQLAETRPDLSDAARSSIDIALWDLAARRADRPLYQLLGAKRDSIEIQSWGHALSQAANLQLMLANDQARFFEAAMPAQPYEFGMKNGIVLQRGRALAPEAPGLGIEVDWGRLDRADFYIRRVVCDQGDHC